MRSSGCRDFRAALCAFVLNGMVLAQAEVADNRVAFDRRSGTVVLRFDAELQRTYGFTTAAYGLTRVKNGGVHNENSQLIVASTPEGGDEFYVGWQPGEVARAVDFGVLPPSAPFERINGNEVQQRIQMRARAVKRLTVQRGHVYAIVIDNPKQAERLVLPGDPLVVKLEVLEHDPGRSATLRWVLLNEPFDGGVADGVLDVRLLPRLPWTDDTRAGERGAIADLLVKAAAGDEDAAEKLAGFGHKMLPATANLLCTLDRDTQDDSDVAWRIDRLLESMTGAPPEPAQKFPAPMMREHHTAMVCRWYALARRYRTAEEWQAALALLKPQQRHR